MSNMTQTHRWTKDDSGIDYHALDCWCRAHQTRVSAAPRTAGQRRTTFYAICTCGWAGASRTTHTTAAREGRSHEDGAR